MIRIQTGFFFSLGSNLRPLELLTAETSLLDAWTPLYNAENGLNNLFGTPAFLPAIRSAQNSGEKLRQAIKAVTSKADFSGKLENDVYAIRSTLSEFNIVLRAALEVADSYFVTRKAAYDTETLISGAQVMFPADLSGKVVEAIPDVREAGKCLAFELSTAAGFHLMRALEVVVGHYWDVVTKGQKRPKQRSLGVYLSKLEEGKHGNAKVIAVLKQIKDLHRNPLVHPDIHLSLEEAIGLFGIVHSAIAAMLPAIPTPSANASLVAAAVAGLSGSAM